MKSWKHFLYDAVGKLGLTVLIACFLGIGLVSAQETLEIARGPCRALIFGRCISWHSAETAVQPEQLEIARGPCRALIFGRCISWHSAETAVQPEQQAIYRLGAGDRLRIIVFGEDDLGGEYEVDGNGYISLPLIGQVRAMNYTVDQFEDVVEATLEEGYLRDARVNVEVINYRPFYILGEVGTPGQYPFINGMNILNAVALAGGYTYRANNRRVFIRRYGASDEEAMPADQTTKIYPGDIIRIGERYF